MSASDLALDDVLRVACRAADAARAIIVGRYLGAFTVSRKGDDSPVTEADREAEQAIRAVLRQAYPGHQVLGEEFGAEGGDPEALRWLVDPIDGTVGFTHRVPLFTTLIALCRGDDPLVGVVDLPALGRRLTAVRGGGAWEGLRRLRVVSDFDPARSLVCHGDRVNFEFAGLLDLYDAAERQVRTFRSYTDAFGHALVALGSAALMIDPDLKPWDIAAPSLLAREAGGVVSLHPDPAHAGRTLVLLGCAPAVAWARRLLPPVYGEAPAPPG